MKMNIGSVSSGYQLSSWIEALKAISCPPLPQSSSPNIAPTTPIAPKTR